MDKILLIDFHNAVYRACVKFGKPIVEGVDDSIIFTYNFFRNLRPIIEMFSPDKVFVVSEGHPQFRYDLYPEYKSNRIIKTASRKDTVDKFSATKNIIVPLLQYLPFTYCKAAAYEADDTIATLCDNMKDEDLTVLTNDSDYMQLLQRGYQNIKVYSPIKKEYMVAPSYPVIMGKSITGDKSDNIPALLTPKKAQAVINDPELFKQFMSVEENRANFNINRQLVEFRSVPLEELIISEGKKDFDTLRYKFNEMKFESITNDASWQKYTKTFDCIRF
jgi:5'-3' exonuclease